MQGRVALSITVLALCVVADARAQEVPLYLLPPLGSEVRVHYRVLGVPTRVEGILVSGTARDIAIEAHPGVRRDLSAELLIGLEVRGGRSARRGLVTGLVLGGIATAAAAGLITTLTFDDRACLLECNHGEAQRSAAVSGAVIGALMGAAIGAGFAPTSWERVW